MLLTELIKEGVQTLLPVYPEREAREMVFFLLEHLLGVHRHEHIIEPKREILASDAEAVHKAYLRLAAGEPVQYVTGTAYFYGRKFNVAPGVLIPRQETEILCRKASEMLHEAGNCSGSRVLDMCTGSGCIAWTMALECPGSVITAIDISETALEIAGNQNFSEEISRTGAKTPYFLRADVLDCSDAGLLAPEAPSYDMILSNPPYVMDKEKALMHANVLDHEPHLALFVSDEDPLVFYRAVAAWAEKKLVPGGLCLVEINEALGPETAACFAKSEGFDTPEIIQDLNGRDRFVSVRRSLSI